MRSKLLHRGALDGAHVLVASEPEELTKGWREPAPHRMTVVRLTSQAIRRGSGPEESVYGRAARWSHAGTPCGHRAIRWRFRARVKAKRSRLRPGGRRSPEAWEAAKGGGDPARSSAPANEALARTGVFSGWPARSRPARDRGAGAPAMRVPLFIALLHRLKRLYRRARRIVLVVDKHVVYTFNTLL